MFLAQTNREIDYSFKNGNVLILPAQTVRLSHARALELIQVSSKRIPLKSSLPEFK